MTRDRSPITRRRALAVGVGATLGGLSVPREWFRSPPRRTTTVPTDAWPMRRRDPARTGFAPNADAPTRRPSVRWKARLPDEHSTRRWLASSGETTYVASDRWLRAFDAATGKLRWRTSDLGTLPWTDERTWVETPPMLADGQVLVGASVDVYALDAADGRAEWAYETNSSLDETLRAGTTVYVSSLVGRGDRLAALDVRSGLERWITPPGAGVHPKAAARGRVVGPTIRGGAFGAVDADTGATKWTRSLRTGDAHRTGACIANRTVYCGNGPLYALALADGTTRWSRSLGIADAELEPISDGEQVYLAVGESDRVLALDAGTGEVAWDREVTGAVDASPPALANGTLYVGVEDGVVALDASSGERRFRVSKSASAGWTNAPIVADGTLYVALDRTLYAFEES